MEAGVKFVGMVCLAVAILVVPAVAQDDGAVIYKSKCQKCHGVDGMSHTKIVQMQDADLVAVVTNGRKHMPAFGKKLTGDQIASVVAYIHTLQKPATN